MSAWVHVITFDGVFASAKVEVDTLLSEKLLNHSLDGTNVKSVSEFFDAIEKAVPLISGFGKNENSLLDLFRTYGWGDYCGRKHTFMWYRPEVFLCSNPNEFSRVLDILVGVSKELLVGDELDSEFDSLNEADWVPTHLELVFVCGDKNASEEVKRLASVLSDDWADTFTELVIPIEEHDVVFK